MPCQKLEEHIPYNPFTNRLSLVGVTVVAPRKSSLIYCQGKGVLIVAAPVLLCDVCAGHCGLRRLSAGMLIVTHQKNVCPPHSICLAATWQCFLKGSLYTPVGNRQVVHPTRPYVVGLPQREPFALFGRPAVPIDLGNIQLGEEPANFFHTGTYEVDW